MSKNLLDYVGLGYFLEKIKTLFVTGLGTSGDKLTWTKNGTTSNITIPYATKAEGISIGAVDETSTSTAFTASINGINELADGVFFLLKNTKVTSAEGWTLNINGLGAKPVYVTTSLTTRSTTQFAKNYTYLFFYESERVSGGCWVIGQLFNTNTTYSAITADAIRTGTATTARTVTAAVLAEVYKISNGVVTIGGNSITPIITETDPIFSASPAAGITSANITNWSDKYSLPSGGIPKSDLSSAVQTSLDKADTALQSFTETDPTVPSWAKQSTKPSYTASEVGALPDTTNYAGSQSVGGAADKAISIPFGYTDSTSTATAFTATVDGITELRDGVCCIIDNTAVAGSSNGFTLNVNGLGAKTVYSINSNMHSNTTIATTWVKPYRGFLIYQAAMNNDTGGWIIGYLTNTTYAAITASAIETGTATTARTVTAAVLKAAYNIDTTTGTIKIGANSITPYQLPNDGIPMTDLASAVQTSLGKADTALQSHQDISGKENISNKVTSLSSSSTDTQYPSAKCVYDLLANVSNYVFIEGQNI